MVSPRTVCMSFAELVAATNFSFLRGASHPGDMHKLVGLVKLNDRHWFLRDNELVRHGFGRNAPRLVRMELAVASCQKMQGKLFACSALVNVHRQAQKIQEPLAIRSKRLNLVLVLEKHIGRSWQQTRVTRRVGAVKIRLEAIYRHAQHRTLP